MRRVLRAQPSKAHRRGATCPQEEGDMPEFIYPGVFVEEVSFRSKSIEGVSTSTAGFVGATAVGPTDGPVRISSPPERTAPRLDRASQFPTVYSWSRQG